MLTKQAIDVSFAMGLDTKTDPKRIPTGSFRYLENTIFTKGGLLQKRNGYAALASLPDTSYAFLTTLNGNLTAFGQNIAAYSSGTASWVTKGNTQPLSLSTLPVIRNNLNQNWADVAIGPNGLMCVVYQENDGTNNTVKYVIADSVTGQNIVAPAPIPVAAGTVVGGAKVFILGNNFVIVFANTITAVHHLQYIAISCYNPTVASAEVDIASAFGTFTTISWDASVGGNYLYVAYETSSGGQAVKMTSLSSSFVLATPVTFAGSVATIVSVTVDESGASPQVYLSFFSTSTHTGYTAATDAFLNVVFNPVEIISTGNYLNITSAASKGICNIFLEVNNSDGPTGLTCHYTQGITVDSAGTAGSLYVVARSLGLATKAFAVNGVNYFVGVFASTYQSTYFIVNGSLSTAAAPVIVAKLAYQNAGSYSTWGLSNVNIQDNAASFAYLYKDLIQAVNKDTDVSSGTQTAGIYSQTGVNLAKATFGTQGMDVAEIASDLHVTGGFLWMYDGYIPVEHNFFLYPDTNSSMVSWSASGGSMHAQPDGATNTNAYFYQFTYEWTDNQGNAYRSAPSIPVPLTTTGSGTAGSVTVNVPTLRLTMKTANPVKIVIYRWSVGQQNYFQTTSITAPLLNSTTVDSVQFVDTHADATILGNNLIYTTGGVVEDVNAPASSLLSLFDTRLWLVDAEDPNLLWYSKQVIEATPVEMSDLFTMYIPPTTSTEGTTGPITAISVMDDKLILFKENAILYINGTGPDNAGNNSGYSPPIFITSTVGCANQKSIVLMPTGLMFQSNKGIWILNRGIGTEYIGAPVEEFTNGATVTSAVNVPETNQVRFTLDSGITLMYDYYFGQWGTFTGVPAVSSCIYEGAHTFINSYGAAYQESPGTFLDGSNPTLIKFQTGPLRLAELQSYQRAYFFFLLGTYLSPHKLVVNLYYDYATSPSQQVILTPPTFAGAYGSQTGPYGEAGYGGYGNLEQFRVFLQQQRCQAFAISVQEIFDPSQGASAGGGLTLSGIQALIGFKDKKPKIPAALSFG